MKFSSVNLVFVCPYVHECRWNRFYVLTREIICLYRICVLPPCPIEIPPSPCPELTDPANGMVTWTGLTPGSTATYTCNEGFELNGVQTRTCQSDATWSDDPPTCDRT